MRATIVVDDNMIYVDGKGASVDCSALAAKGLHAVQWHDTFGEEEFRTEIVRQVHTRKPHNKITDISPYQTFIDEWELANAKKETEELTHKRKIEGDWMNAQMGMERERIAHEKFLKELESLPPPETLEQMVTRIVKAELDKRDAK